MKTSHFPLMRSNVPVRPKLDHVVLVSLPTDRSAFDEAKGEMHAWVAEHVVGAYATGYLFVEGVGRRAPRRFAYRFELEDDAFRFKMWWG
jgi:hypothetical protein